MPDTCPPCLSFKLFQPLLNRLTNSSHITPRRAGVYIKCNYFNLVFLSATTFHSLGSSQGLSLSLAACSCRRAASGDWTLFWNNSRFALKPGTAASQAPRDSVGRRKSRPGANENPERGPETARGRCCIQEVLGSGRFARASLRGCDHGWPGGKSHGRFGGAVEWPV